MPMLKNIKHETFVQCLTKGMSQRKSYLEAYPNSKKWKDKTIDNRASELANSREVLGRLRELQERSENQAIASVSRRKMILTEILENEEEKANDRIKAIDSLNKMESIGGESLTLKKDPYNELSVEELRKLARSDKYG